VVLSANPSGLTYQWYNGFAQVGNGSSYTATVGGNYTVEVTSAEGCKSVSSPMAVTVNANQPTDIQITSPTANSTVTGTSVDINVTATDPDGSITLVEYLDGTTVIGSSMTQPYSYTWNNPPVGSHDISVRVTDSNGGVTTSTPVTFVVATQTGLLTASGNEAFSKIYPNPSSGVVHIETDLYLTNAAIKLVDALGAEADIILTVTDKNAIADVSGLAAGVYTLHISQGDLSIRKKIIVIH
jgi:hypothetical protein